MGCATGVVKLIMFIFNFVCAIVGLVVLTIASISIVGLEGLDSVSTEHHTLVPGLFIGIGLAIFIISFLGCCGVWQKSQYMLIAYAAALLLLFGVQLGIGIFGITKLPSDDDSEHKETFFNELNASFKKFPRDEVIRTYINAFQHDFGCCGIYNYTDYEQFDNKHIPGTCCDKPADEMCQPPPTYTDGCGDKLYEAVKYFLGLAVYVNLGICATEIVGAFFAICLVNSYRNDERRGVQ